MLADCHALVAELRRDDVAAVGLAVCELVDPRGRVRSAETVDWRETDLLASFDAVESDVRAAAVAESRFGAGREEPDFLYVSVGTGISHCLIVDGQPRTGVRGCAIGTGAPLVERWSGGLALARLSGHATAEAALADPDAERIVAAGARRLGLVLAALVNALDPGAIVVGGGLGLNDAYRERVERSLRGAVYDAGAQRAAGAPGRAGPRRPGRRGGAGRGLRLTRVRSCGGTPARRAPRRRRSSRAGAARRRRCGPRPRRRGRAARPRARA